MMEKEQLAININMFSDVQLPVLIRNCGRQNNQPTDRPSNQLTDTQTRKMGMPGKLHFL